MYSCVHLSDNITADFNHLIFSSVLCNLEIMLDQGLAFAPRIHCPYFDFYNQLSQFHTVAYSLTPDAAAALINFVITVWLDTAAQCAHSMLASQLGGCSAWTSRQVLCSVTRHAGHILKFVYILDELYWLPLEQWIAYQIIALVRQFLLGHDPAYLSDLCCPTMSAPNHRSLCSSEWGILIIPLSTQWLSRIILSQWLALSGWLSENSPHWCRTCSPGSTPTLFKLLFSDMLRLRALLS